MRHLVQRSQTSWSDPVKQFVYSILRTEQLSTNTNKYRRNYYGNTPIQCWRLDSFYKRVCYLIRIWNGLCWKTLIDGFARWIIRCPGTFQRQNKSLTAVLHWRYQQAATKVFELDVMGVKHVLYMLPGIGVAIPFLCSWCQLVERL